MSMFTLGFVLTSCGHKPDEEELRTQFFEHKAEINKLLNMQFEDHKVIRIAPKFTWLSNDYSWPRKDLGFSQQRWNQYQDLFKKTGIRDGMSISVNDPSRNFKEQDEYYVVFSVDGYRGFTYTTYIPKQVKSKFKDCTLKKQSDHCFVTLEKNWYLTVY